MSDENSVDEQVTPTAAATLIAERANSHRAIEFTSAALVVVATATGLCYFAWYVFWGSDGAAQVSAGFAFGLTLFGCALLLWSWVRRPPPGHDDDFLDKFLAGAGQAILLGAVLTFGFGLVNGQLASESEQRRAEQSERLENLRFVRDRSGGDDTLHVVERPFVGMDLYEMNLSLLMLPGAEFVRADLRYTDFRNTDLSGADLRNAQLDGAALNSAMLPDAILRSARLVGVNLCDADLTGALMERAILTNADFTTKDCDVRDKDRAADLTGADLTGADLTGADLTGADLTGADLTGADLTDVCYTAKTTWPSDFRPPEPHCESSE